jgi:hypothetical protein
LYLLVLKQQVDDDARPVAVGCDKNIQRHSELNQLLQQQGNE